MPIVYVITNIINGKKYLGKCVHKKPFYLGSGIAIKHAIKKYGRENFNKKILFEVDSLEEAAILEKELSLQWNVVNDSNWYNLKPGGDGGSVRGIKRTKETKQKISKSKRGIPSWNKGLAGTDVVKHSEETKQKIGRSNTGKVLSEDTKNKISNSHIGLKHSEESKKKMSQAHIGKKLTPEHIEKIKNRAITKTYKIISPTGEESIITNLKKFCEINDLSDSSLRNVVSGKRNHHKGWKAMLHEKP